MERVQARGLAKRVVACACSAALAVSMVPAVAFADVADTDAASIGDTGYGSLQDAINAAVDGDTVKMLKDANAGWNDGITVKDKKITLDLNSHNITATEWNAWALSVFSSELTVVDTVAVAGGAVGKIEKAAPGGWSQPQGYAVQMEDSTLKIKQGQFTSSTTSYNIICPKPTAGIADANKNTLIIGEEGADDSLISIKSDTTTKRYNWGSVTAGTIVVNSGTIDVHQSIANAQDVTINGGLIRTSGSPCVESAKTTVNGGRLETTGQACITSGDLTVNGGYFVCENGSNPIATSGAAVLNGGNYSEAPVADITADNVTLPEGQTVGYKDGWYTIGEFSGPSVKNVSMPEAIVGYAIDRIALEAYPAATSFEIAGDLPDGIAFNSANNTIAGTPTKAGTWTFTVTASDADGKGASKEFTWTVVDPQLPVVLTESLPSAKLGESYTCELEASGIPDDFIWEAEGLNEIGLDIDSDTGVISGKLFAGGTHEVSVKVTNSEGTSESKTFTVTGYEAAIGDEPYLTPVEAVAAAEDGSTVTIYGDQVASIAIPAGKSLTLSLGGKLKAEEGKSAIVNDGTLTLAGSGSIESAQDAAAVVTNAGATTSIGVNVNATKGAAVENYGTTKLTGGTLATTGEGKSAVVTGYATKDANASGEKAIFEMTDGTAQGHKYGVEVLAWGEFTMNGGTIDVSDTSNGAPLFVNGTANLTKGAIGAKGKYLPSGSAAIMLGADADFDEAAAPQKVTLCNPSDRANFDLRFVGIYGYDEDPDKNPQIWAGTTQADPKSKGSIEVARVAFESNFTEIDWDNWVFTDLDVTFPENMMGVTHLYAPGATVGNDQRSIWAAKPAVTAPDAAFVLTRDVAAEAIELTATQGDNLKDAEGNYYAGNAEFALAEGSKLPAGLELSADGKITGTPTEKGEFKTSVVASNKTGTGEPVELSFTIEADPAMTAAAAKTAVEEAQNAANEAQEAQGAVAAAEGMAAKAEAAQAAVEKLASAQEAAETAKSVAADAVEAAQAAADKAQAALEEAQAADPVDAEAVAAAQAKLDAAKTSLEVVEDLVETASGLKAEAAEKAPVASALAGAYKEAAASEEALKAANEEAAAAAKAASDAAAKKAEAAETALAAANEKVASLERAAAAASQAAAAGKKDNPMTVKAKKVKAKAKKKTKISAKKAFAVSGAAGKVTFAKLSGNAKVTVKANGKVVVAKGLKKGKTVKVKVLVVDSGNASYAPAVKTVTLKIKVK